jgi:hypothetical protein
VPGSRSEISTLAHAQRIRDLPTGEIDHGARETSVYCPRFVYEGTASYRFGVHRQQTSPAQPECVAYPTHLDIYGVEGFGYGGTCGLA